METPENKNTALLFAAAGALLTTSAAEAATYDENTTALNGDFGNTFTLRTTLPPTTDLVTGNVDGSPDPDFYTYTGLLGGGQFSLKITAGDGGNYSGTFSVLNDTQGQIGSQAVYSGDPAATQKIITGTVPLSGNLTVSIQQSVESGSAAYSTALTVVPEPATTTLALLGAVVAGLATRRRTKDRACISLKES
jgi:hypothetical protein